MATQHVSRMGNSDAVLWGLERDPQLRSTITALAVFDSAPDWTRVVQTIERASNAIPQMRQRAVPSPLRLGTPRWQDDPRFDLDYHLRRVRLPEPGDLDAVLALARVSAMAGFDRVRPLWEFTLVEGLSDGRAVLIEKVHHSVTDGIGGIRLALELFDTSREGARPESVPMPEATGARRRPRLIGPLEALRLARSVGRTLAPVTTTLSPVLRDRGLAWHYGVFDAGFDDLHRAAKAAGGTVNDAFVAAVAGGLARYHERLGAPVSHLRMTMPVNLRTAADPLGGNRFAPARFVVPVGVGDPGERIRRCGALNRAWQAEPALEVTESLAGVLRLLPGPALSGLFGSMLKRVDFVTTDVPGFPVPMFLGGAEVVRHYVLPPPTGAAINVGLLTHVGTACFGVVSDDAAVPDHRLLHTCLREGVEEVLGLG